MLLSVQVKPDAESDTEYVMVSWADEIETATHAAPFSTVPLATTRPDEYTWTDVGPHYGIISIATASGHSVSFDGGLGCCLCKKRYTSTFFSGAAFPYQPTELTPSRYDR